MIPHTVEVQLLALGFLAARNGWVDIAFPILQAVEQSHPTRAAGYIGLTLAHFAVGRLQEAVTCAERGLRYVADSEQAELHALRGIVLHAAGFAHESRQALERAGDCPLAQDYQTRQMASTRMS
jgi:hypothetical protein